MDIFGTKQSDVLGVKEPETVTKSEEDRATARLKDPEFGFGFSGFQKEPETVTRLKEASLVGVNTRNALVLKTVFENLTKVANSLVVQVAKEGADPAMVDLLNESIAKLDSIRPLP